jgi:hypothetical protein
MFDRTQVNFPHTLNVRVDEHRAPTDDSVRIFGEYREKAIQSILDAGRDSLTVDQIEWVVEDAPEIIGIRIHLTFFVDGRKCRESFPIMSRELFGSDEMKLDFISGKIRKHVTEAVSMEIEKRRDLWCMIAGKVEKYIKGGR